MGRRPTDQQRSEVLAAIPGNWSLLQSLAFREFEWVTNGTGDAAPIIQLRGPNAGVCFHHHAEDTFISTTDELVDVTDWTLYWVRVAETGGDLQSTILNPEEKFSCPILRMGLVRNLPFDPTDWKWREIYNFKEADFFNYVTKRGYYVASRDKPHRARLLTLQDR